MMSSPLSKTFLHYSKIYFTQLKNSLIREATYRTHFFTTIIVNYIWMWIEISLFSIIYANVQKIGDWTEDQVYFFLGFFFLVDALFTVLFDKNFWHFTDLINKRDLDSLLLKPAHPIFLIFSHWINLAALFNCLLGISILLRFSTAAGFPGGWHWLLICFWACVSISVAVLIRFFFTVWVFWTDRNWAISRMFYQFFALGTKPDTFYPKKIRYVLMSILPFAWMGSIPSRALLHGLTITEYGILIGVLSGFWILNTFLWRAGLKRYQNTTS